MNPRLEALARQTFGVDATTITRAGPLRSGGTMSISSMGKIGSVSDTGIGRMPLWEALKVLGLPFHN